MMDLCISHTVRLDNVSFNVKMSIYCMRLEQYNSTSSSAADRWKHFHRVEVCSDWNPWISTDRSQCDMQHFAMSCHQTNEKNFTNPY